jgi:Tfp pilus assembly protein PilF
VAADPLALQPRFVLSSLYESIHDLPAARDELTEAVSIQPRNRDSWLQLGLFDLSQDHPRQALPSLERAVALDPTIPATVDALGQARAELASAR